MLLTLVALSDGPDLVIDKPVMLLGRHGECDVQLNSGKISRKHCIIARVNDKMVVRDLGSTNGVRINGKRLAESPLAEGDELAIGNFCYRVRLGAAFAKVDDSELESAEEPIALVDGAADDAPLSGRLPQDTATRQEL